MNKKNDENIMNNTTREGDPTTDTLYYSSSVYLAVVGFSGFILNSKALVKLAEVTKVGNSITLL